MEEILKQLIKEEEELQFIKFNEDTAWQIGSNLVTQAITDRLPITIDITRGDHQVFHASRPGTSADNDEWVKRKVRLVYRFGHSSFYIGQLLKSKGKRLEEAYLISESLYAPNGGRFLIPVKRTRVIVSITGSWRVQAEGHVAGHRAT